MKRRIAAFVCVLVLVCTLLPSSFAAADYVGHWAQADIELLSGLGVMKGYPDGSFKPNNSITKAEYITLLNRVFGLQATQSVSAPDLLADKWYYAEIERAAAAGYLFTFGGKVAPDGKLTREEAAAMFGRLLGLATSGSATSFTDDGQISSWAKPYIPAVAAAKIISGYPDGSFHPTATITRAEVARVLKNVCGAFFGAAGSYTPMDLGTSNAMVMVSGVTLNNMDLPGNLYISGAVGTGTVTLNNCRIGGRIIGFGNPGATIRFVGTTQRAAVDGDGLNILVDGQMSELVVTAESARPNVTVGAGAVGSLYMKTPGTVTGFVQHLDASASGVTATVLPDRWTLGEGVTATLGGREYNTSGTRGPGFEAGYPKAESRHSSDGKKQEIVLKVKLAQAGQVYAIAVPYGSAVPTDEQVKAMQDYGTVKIAAFNFASVTTPSMELSLTLRELTLDANYDIYVVAESTGAKVELGSAVKISPDVQLMAPGYPKIGNLSADAATVLVKTLSQAQIYMMALPTGSAAPTAAQLYAQSGVTGAVVMQGAVFGGTEESLTVSGLVSGPGAYDLYVGAAPIGAGAITTEITKFTLSGSGNAVAVQYSTTATGGVYPGYTILTLRFYEPMYKAGTLTPMGQALDGLITVTGTDLVTGAVSAVTGFTLSDAGDNTLLLIPPSGGWVNGVKYTVSLRGLASAAGVTPVPSEIAFTVGTPAAAGAPRFNLPTGSVVAPGTRITATSDVPNAVIQYTWNGSDPLTGSFMLTNGPTLELTIPANAVKGAKYRFRAVTRLGSGYSEAADVIYTVG